MKPWPAIFILFFFTFPTFSQAPVKVEKCELPPLLDGQLDDPVWSKVARYDNFIS